MSAEIMTKELQCMVANEIKRNPTILNMCYGMAIFVSDSCSYLIGHYYQQEEAIMAEPRDLAFNAAKIIADSATKCLCFGFKLSENLNYSLLASSMSQVNRKILASLFSNILDDLSERPERISSKLDFVEATIDYAWATFLEVTAFGYFIGKIGVGIETLAYAELADEKETILDYVRFDGTIYSELSGAENLRRLVG